MAWDIATLWNTGDINTRNTSSCAINNVNGTSYIIAPIQHGVRCYDKDGVQKWSYNGITNGYDVRDIAVGDLTGTGYSDCIVVTSGYYSTATDGKVAILKNTGSSYEVLQLLRTNDFTIGSFSTTTNLAIDGTDIYISTSFGVTKFVKSGSAWSEDAGWNKSLGTGSGLVKVADTGNGKRIFATGGNSTSTYGIYCYQPNGTQDWFYQTGNSYSKVFHIGKFDSSKTGLQIALAGQSAFHIIDKDGNLLQNQNSLGTNVRCSVTSFDCDSDGEEEIYYTDMGGEVWCIERTDVNTYTQKYLLYDATASSQYAGITHFDINEDGEEEVILFTSNGYLLIYDKTLTTLLKSIYINHGSAGGFYQQNQFYGNGIYFTDINSDGHSEIVIAGGTGFVDVIQGSGYEVSGQNASVNSPLLSASISLFNPQISAIRNPSLILSSNNISFQTLSPSIIGEKYGHEIHKRIGNGDWYNLAFVNENTSEFEDDSSFVNGETYWYRVRKVQGVIVESWSNEVSIIYSASNGDVNTTSSTINLILSSFTPDIKGIINSSLNCTVILNSISTISPLIVGYQNNNTAIPNVDISSIAIIPSISSSINITVLATPITIQIDNAPPQISVTTNNIIPIINTDITAKSPLVVGSGNNSIIPNCATINVLCQVPDVNGTRNSNILTSSIIILNNTKVPSIVGKQNVSISIDNIVIPIQGEHPIVLGQINTLENAPLSYANVFIQPPIIDSSKNVNLQVPIIITEINSESPIVETQGSKTVSVAKSASIINALYPLIIGEKNTLTSLPITSINIGINTPIIRADKNVSIIPNCINTTLHTLSASITTSQGLFVSVPKVSILLNNNTPTTSSIRNCFVNVPNTQTNILSLTHIISGKQNKNIDISTVEISILTKQPHIRVDDIIHVSSLQSTIVPLDPYITSNRNISNNIVLSNVSISINKPIVIGQTNNIILITKPSIEVNSLQPIVNSITNCDTTPSSLVVDIKTLNPEISSNRNADIQIESASLTIVMISPLVKVILKYTGYKMSVSDTSRNINVSDYQHRTVCSVLNRRITTQVSSNKTSIGIKEHGSSISDYDV